MKRPTAERVSPRYLFIFIYLISPLTRPRQRYTQFQAEKASTRVAFDKFYNTLAVCEREWAARLATAAHSPATAASSLQTHTPAHSLFAAAQVYGSQQRINSLRAHNENKKPLKLNTQFWLTASSVCLFVASCC